MEQIKAILANSQSNYKERQADGDQIADDGSEDNLTNRLAEMLKTGYQTRKFSDTSTLSWLQTWRKSNLSPLESK
ncbi:MAG: hypothetical protein ACJZ8I_02295 [Paracoccaceae bacterium]